MNQQQNQLVLNNLGLAYDFAGAYQWHPRHKDIIQSCILGLCEAALRWDEEGKATFATYAYYWMRNCTGVELKDTSPIVDPAVSELLRSDDYEELLVSVLYQPSVREVLLRIVYELPENERHAVLLKYPLDAHSRTYTDVEIAGMLECSAPWVGVLRKRAFDRLREKLSEEEVR